MSDFSIHEIDLAARQPPGSDRRALATVPFVEFKREAIEGSIPDRFQQQVRRYPNRIAVKTRRHQLTYETLNQEANRVAHAILTQRGEGNEPIALLLENDAPMITTILGVLKAGKTFVPLDCSFPRARLTDILEDSGAGLIVTNNQNLAVAKEFARSGCELINVDAVSSCVSTEDLCLPIAPSRFACILYTSGSTGKPKGVIQNHRNLLHEIRTLTNSFHICAEDRFTLLFSPSVIAGERDIFGALLNGAALYGFELKQEGAAGLANWLIQEELTICHFVPTLFRHFARTLTGNEGFPKVRLIHIASEPVRNKDVELYKRHFSPECILVVRLGSTETLTVRMRFIDHQTQTVGSIVPVGYAVEDKEALLLDAQGQEVGMNQIGEIAIKSRYLSPGYWQRPDLTAAAFRPPPEGEDERTYLMGDLGRFHPDGCLEYLGRKDFQVKIRGHSVSY